ncbi:MAG: SurA N-terminal domain-containing protein [Bacteroidales bacterium]|nr:SurA N-terminal domain-containing protein [Bacteroidales bacterium]
MAVLEKIRVKFGLAISIIIALALLSFIIDPNTLGSAVQSMSSKYDVGKIAGKSISYTDYQADIDRYTTINQLMTGSSVQNEETQQQIRNAAWQELVDKYMFIKNAKDAGIHVGEDEMVDLMSGDNISPLIAQNGAFLDENGEFSIDALMSFKESVDSDETGRLRTYWNFLQNSIYTQQYYAKYGSLFNATSGDNALTLKNAVAENNATANIDYVVSYYPLQKDSSITVSSAEIANYYKDHKNFFKQNANRDAEYVVFEVIPSEADINAVSEDFQAAYDGFAAAENIKAYLLKNSDRQFSTYWYNAEELSTIASELVDFAKEAGVGAVSPIIKNGNTFVAAKVVDKKKLPDNITVKVISAAGSEEITDELLQNLEVAQPMQMTQSYLIPGCEVLFDAALNQPQIIKSVQYGNMLAEVIEKSEPVEKKQIAILEKTATASNETINSYYSKASNFAKIAAGSYEGYKKALDSTKVYSHSINVTEGTANYGAIENAKEVTRWIFDNKVGKASDIITVNQNYFFIAAVKEINKEGFRPVEKVASSIESILYNEKAHQKAKEDFAAKVAGLTSLEAIAEKIGGTVASKEGVSFSSVGAAVEPALIGAAASAPENKICGPVAGQIGMYMFQVSNRENGTFYTEDDAKNFSAQKAQYNSQMIVPVMMEQADVKDNRARFF